MNKQALITTASLRHAGKRLSAPAAQGGVVIPAAAIWGATLDRCPFRSLIGSCKRTAAAHVSLALAVIAGDPEPIAFTTMAEIVAALDAGQVVMVMSDRDDLRRYAVRQVLAMVGPAAGIA